MGVDYGDMVSESASRIGASLDEVGCKNLKTLGAQQPQECPDTNLPSDTPTQVVVKDPPQSPKTLTARGSCQDQKIFPFSRRQENRTKQRSDQLIGFVGWWRRVEKEEEREGVARDQNRRKKDDRKRKSDAKVSFLKQNYPDAHSTPGGTLRIRNIR